MGEAEWSCLHGGMRALGEISAALPMDIGAISISLDMKLNVKHERADISNTTSASPPEPQSRARRSSSRSRAFLGIPNVDPYAHAIHGRLQGTGRSRHNLTRQTKIQHTTSTRSPRPEPITAHSHVPAIPHASPLPSSATMSHPLERTTSNSSVATVTGNADREQTNPNTKTLRYQNTYVCRVSPLGFTHMHESIDRINNPIQGTAA